MKITIEGTAQEIKEIMGIKTMDNKTIIKNAKPVVLDAPKKERSEKAQKDIAAIKEAYLKKRGECDYGDAIKRQGHPRKDIDVDEVVRLRDEDHLSFSAIGRIMGVSYKTIIDRYKEVKG